MGDKYDESRVLGIAIRSTGELLKPFLSKQPELLKLIESIDSDEKRAAWYPLADLISLLAVAEENQFVEQLAKSWAMNVVRLMRKHGGVDTPENALSMIALGFKAQHQGEVGEFTITRKSLTSAEIVDSAYAPCGYFATFAERTIANFGAQNIKVVHAAQNCRNNGALACKYRLTWEESNLLKLRREQEGAKNSDTPE